MGNKGGWLTLNCFFRIDADTMFSLTVRTPISLSVSDHVLSASYLSVEGHLHQMQENLLLALSIPIVIIEW